MTSILFQMHIMWYELDMVEETLDSLSNAIQHSNIPVSVKVCFNKQTYLEKPLVNNIDEKFDKLRSHPVLKNAVIIEKTDAEPFYNVGDWRREIKSEEGYTVWGESDTLIPDIYFRLLEEMWNIRDTLTVPHALSLSSRKMWDSTWTPVEHVSIQNETLDTVNPLLRCDGHINQEQLDVFNAQYSDSPQIQRILPPKIDGSMLAITPSMPQLIGDEVQMCGEDFCAQLVIDLYNIPQYHVINIIKGHNYTHPRKRTNTEYTRADAPHMEYKNKSMGLIQNYINTIKNKRG